jgi:hypothetical protein
VFLSYARVDAKEADRVVHVIQQRGFSVWWDPAISPGEMWDQSIQAALRAARAVVVLWSQDSVTRNWVKAEAADALERGTLVPVLLEPADIPLQFRFVQTADLTGWDGAADDPRVERLLQAIADRVERAGHQSSSPTTAPVQASVGAPARKELRPALWAIPTVCLAVAGGCRAGRC